MPASQYTAPYLIAVYVIIGAALVVSLVVLICVCRSKRYRLNWFERTVLASEERTRIITDEKRRSDVNVGGAVRQSRVVTWASGHRMGSSPSSPTSDCSEKFWVPPNVVERKRAQSLTPSLILQNGSSEDVSNRPSPIPSPTPGVKEVTFHFSHDLLSRGGMGMSVDIPPIKHAPPNTQRRRASMHDAIDHTKIDMRLYDKLLFRQQSVSSIQEEKFGSLNFSLEYQKDTSLLSVRLIQARDIIPVEFIGAVNPYCKLALLPHRTAQVTSKIQRDTVNPEFEEEFLFDVTPDDLSHTTLEILVFHYDQYSRDECLGDLHIDLKDFDLSEKAVLWKAIIPHQREEEHEHIGDLMFSLAYLSSAERLTVTITKARQLKPPNGFKLSLDPYVKVTIVYKGKKLKKKKTSTQHNTSNPVWNEALTFGLAKQFLADIQLEFTAFHDNKIGTDLPLGKVTISPESVDDVKYSHWREFITGHNTSARWHSLDSH